MRETLRAPFRISVKDQLGVGEGLAAARRKGKFIQQLRAAVEPCIRRDPMSPVETSRLPFVLRFAGRPQEGMSETNRCNSPARSAIRAPVGEKIHERLQQRRLNRCTVPMKNADDSTQSFPHHPREAYIPLAIYVVTLGRFRNQQAGTLDSNRATFL